MASDPMEVRIRALEMRVGYLEDVVYSRDQDLEQAFGVAVTPLVETEDVPPPPPPCTHQHQTLIANKVTCVKCGYELGTSGVVGRDPGVERAEWAQQAKEGAPEA